MTSHKNCLILGPSGDSSKSDVGRESRITFRTLWKRHQKRDTEVRRNETSNAHSHKDASVSHEGYLDDAIEMLDVGSLGTRRMLELALAKNARFLVTSTSECYGDPLVHPQVETYWGNVNPVGPRSCYDESKRFAEALTMAYHRKHGLRTNIPRVFT